MKTKNWITHTTTFMMVASQLALGSMQTAHAEIQKTPEFNFIYGVEALKGQNIPQAAKKEALIQLTSLYSQNSQPDGRVERFSQALVDLKIANSDEATLIAEKAQNDPESLSGLSLEGAQFSSCALTVGLGAAVMVGGGFGAYAADMRGQAEVIGITMAVFLGGMIMELGCAD